MHWVSDDRSRSSSAIRRSIRAVQLPDSRAQSARPARGCRGSREFRADLVERQPDLLREDDEGDPPQHRTGIAAVAGAGALATAIRPRSS